jgi:23S rRNA pseudouridine955/2504/2580 synthase
VISFKNDVSLLEVELVTGRTHQIRAHLSHIGHPLLGDGKYGVNKDDKARGYKYQALYSYRLIFDFGNDEGYLGYLSGRQVSLAPSDVWFISEFEGAEEKIRKIINSK